MAYFLQKPGYEYFRQVVEAQDILQFEFNVRYKWIGILDFGFGRFKIWRVGIFIIWLNSSGDSNLPAARLAIGGKNYGIFAQRLAYHLHR